MTAPLACICRTKYHNFVIWIIWNEFVYFNLLKQKFTLNALGFQYPKGNVLIEVGEFLQKCFFSKFFHCPAFCFLFLFLNLTCFFLPILARLSVFNDSWIMFLFEISTSSFELFWLVLIWLVKIFNGWSTWFWLFWWPPFLEYCKVVEIR